MMNQTPSQQKKAINKNTDNFALGVIAILSVFVLGFLVWLIYINQGVDAGDTHFSKNLPTVNAFLNFTTTCLLIAGFLAIKKGLKSLHIKLMLCATVSSGLFLVSYVIYHYFQGDTKFLAQGLIRPVYFFILVTHIVLSIVLVPGVFLTLYRASRKQWDKHRKIAKITFPIWVYVSVTGVLIYIFLKFFNV